MGTGENSGWDGRGLATLFCHPLFKSVLSALPSNSTQTPATSPQPSYPPVLPRTPPLPWVIAVTPHRPSTSILDHHPLHSILSTAVGRVMFEITFRYSSVPNHGSHFTQILQGRIRSGPCHLRPQCPPLTPLTYSTTATLTSSHTPSTHLPQGLCTCCTGCLVHPSLQIVTQLHLYLLRPWLSVTSSAKPCSLNPILLCFSIALLPI